DDRARRVGRYVRRERGLRRADVALLLDALARRLALARADAAEVEAERRHVGADERVDDRDDDVVVHITAVLRMRMADDGRPPRRARRQVQHGFEAPRRLADREARRRQAVSAATCIMNAMSPSMRRRPVMNASWPFRRPSCNATASASFILR